LERSCQPKSGSWRRCQRRRCGAWCPPPSAPPPLLWLPAMVAAGVAVAAGSVAGLGAGARAILGFLATLEEAAERAGAPAGGRRGGRGEGIVTLTRSGGAVSRVRPRRRRQHVPHTQQFPMSRGPRAAGAASHCCWPLRICGSVTSRAGGKGRGPGQARGAAARGSHSGAGACATPCLPFMRVARLPGRA
jgi:hypothetical protein